MNFLIKRSYNLDLLNYVNVITGDEFYTRFHPEGYLKFKDRLSQGAKSNIKELVKINESSMLGPVLCLVISSVPDFNSMNLQELILNTDLIKNYFSQSIYYEGEIWEAKEEILNLILPVIRELEEEGFYKYWAEERLPKINESMKELDEFLSKYHINEDIENMLGTRSIDEITLYLCSFASPHGMKICGNSFISDISFPKETTLLVAVHEMFHPPYNSQGLKEELKKIAEEPFFINAFKTKDPRFGYSEIDGFIEENVVEAMSLLVCEKLDLVKDSIEYLKLHDEGSHVFSVILMKYFKLYEKPKGKSFEDYFKDLVKVLPFGSFKEEYDEIINSHR